MDAAAPQTSDIAATQAPARIRQKWQPFKFLSRFRSRVSSLTHHDEALPVQRDVVEPQEPHPNAADAALRSYACDVVYLCADATPADALMREQSAVADCSFERSALAEVHQRLRAIYSVGGCVPSRYHVREMVKDALHGEASDRIASLVNFLAGPLNDALCREQSLLWLAEAGLQMHLYGIGWNQHPELRQFAHELTNGGHDDELVEISRSGAINLRLTRCDVTDPVLSSGVRAGAFFLMRFFPEDVIERIYQPLYQFCVDREITEDDQLRTAADHLQRRLLAFAEKTLGMSVFDTPGGFVPMLRRAGENGLSSWPGSVWGEDYDAVSFSSRDELVRLVKRYLDDAPERRRIAGAMRRKLAERREPGGSANPAGAETHRDEALVRGGEVAA